MGAVCSGSLPELFAAQAVRTPEADAVVFGEARLSYGELDARANRLGHHLRTLGVGPEVVVGLCLERSLDLVVGLLGIVKAGGAYLPLDPEYPGERLSFMLADAGAGVVVTREGLRDRVGAYGGRLLCLDGEGRNHRRAATAPAGGGVAPAPPRLRHLYLRIDRKTQRRGGHPWELEQRSVGDAGAGWG